MTTIILLLIFVVFTIILIELVNLTTTLDHIERDLRYIIRNQRELLFRTKEDIDDHELR